MSPRRGTPDDNDDLMAGSAFLLPGNVVDVNMQHDWLVHKLDAADTPLRQLIRHWQNERYAPAILPGQEAVLNTLLDHIRRQV
jgi:hypothetical protein